MDITKMKTFVFQGQNEESEKITEWEKGLASHISDKGLASRMYKVLTTQRQLG